ncbi:hypothetical protein [Allocoleopsis sp.]|uniref:hypothetical protein n=1 Tax=Allocoleopsis sp. TaxID=3088169 RepID=UPI002FD54EE6
MSTEPVTQCCHRNLLSDHRSHTDEAKPELTDLPNASERRWASSLRHVSSVAMYTLAAFAAQDFAHQALATPVLDPAQQPQLKEAGELAVSATTEEAATTQARLAHSKSAVASPESLNIQEFAPDVVRASDSPITPSDSGEQEAVVPTLKSSTPPSIRASIAPPETEVMLARTSVQNDWSTRGVGTESSQKDEKVQFLEQRESLSSTSPSPILNPQLGSAMSLAAVPSNSARDLQEVPTSDSDRPAIGLATATPTLQEAAKPQQTGEVMAQTVPKSCCLAYTPASPQTGNSQQMGQVVAQATTTGCCASVETQRQAKDLQNELRDLENVKVEEGFLASPALSIYIPTGFGADNNTGFIGATFQERTRYSNVSDGGAVIGVGLGDAQKAVGVELSYTAASFGGSRDFGGGGFNAKVHRQLGDGLAVAAGWNGFANLGGRNDFENSIYGVVSKVFRTRDDINSPFSRVAVTAGVGNGQFRTEDAVAKDEGGIGVFGNVAVRVARPVSLIAEWSGQDLGFGLSLAPFKNIPLVITPAVRDVVGAGDGPRFVLGTGLAFKF